MTYNPQILALQAAASINADGTTPITYGCAITRFSSGIYKLILPTGLGVIDAQSFTKVTQKGTIGVAVIVSDESDFIKTISCFSNVEAVLVDTAIEVFEQRATVNPF
jgi:hypothetical protein